MPWEYKLSALLCPPPAAYFTLANPNPPMNKKMPNAGHSPNRPCGVAVFPAVCRSTCDVVAVRVVDGRYRLVVMNARLLPRFRRELSERDSECMHCEGALGIIENICIGIHRRFAGPPHPPASRRLERAGGSVCHFPPPPKSCSASATQ